MFIRCLPVLFILAACTQSKQPDVTPLSSGTMENQSLYDSLLAAKWGADPYGMKSYILVFLKKGPNRSKDSTTRAQLQAGHMANINRLAEEGKLIMAGPMMDDGDIRGI